MRCFTFASLPLFVVAGRVVAALSLVVAGVGGLYADTQSPQVAPTRAVGDTAPIKIVIENRTDEPLVCIISLAHWFAEPLDPVGPGGEAAIALQHAPQTGLLTRLNDNAEAMPVEALTCAVGPAKAGLDLPIKTGAAPPLIRHACGLAQSGLVCQIN